MNNIKILIVSFSLFASFSGHTITIHKSDDTASLSIKVVAGPNYKVTVCEASKVKQRKLCASDIVSLDIISKRFERRSTHLQEIFSSSEKVNAIKERMRSEIELSGQSELTLMPGVIIKADASMQLDWLFPMILEEVKGIKERRDHVLEQASHFLRQAHDMQDEVIVTSSLSYSDLVDEIISKLFVELKGV